MRLRLALVPLALPLLPLNAGAQVMDVRSVTPPAAAPGLGALRSRQTQFETFRRENLPKMRLGRGGSGSCDEQVGRFCYWYDETQEPAPSEPTVIVEARQRFIATLDSAAAAFPDDRWTSGQLVRYLTEAGRNAEAVRAAERCEVDGWWCLALQGFALHADGRYAASDSAWSRALDAMDERQSCEWSDLKLLLDDGLLRDYRLDGCAGRRRLEQRVWWLSRPMMS